MLSKGYTPRIFFSADFSLEVQRRSLPLERKVPRPQSAAQKIGLRLLAAQEFRTRSFLFVFGLYYGALVGEILEFVVVAVVCKLVAQQI